MESRFVGEGDRHLYMGIRMDVTLKFYGRRAVQADICEGGRWGDVVSWGPSGWDMAGGEP